MPEETKNVPEYVNLTPIQKVRARLKAGVPLENLLRYMHGQSKVSKEIQSLVAISTSLDQAQRILRPLIAEKSVLRSGLPGELADRSADLVAVVSSLFAAEVRLKVALRVRVEELAKND